MFNTIYSKLMVSYITVILVVLFAVGFSLTYLLEEYFIRNKTTELMGKGQDIISIGRSILVRQDKMAEELLPVLDRFIEARIWIVDNDGKIIATSHRGRQAGNQGIMHRERLAVEEMEALLAGEIISRRANTSYYDISMVSTGLPVVAGEKIVGGIFLHSPVSGIQTMVRQIQSNLLYAALLAVVIAGAVSLWLSRGITQPVKTMNNAALAMADGDFSQKIQVASGDELGTLASTLNNLSSRLDETLNILSEERDKLAHTVASIDEGVIAVNTEQEIVLVNSPAVRLFRPELSVEEMLGKSVEEAIPFLGVSEVLKGVVKEGQKNSELIRLNTAMTVLMQVSPIRNSLGDGIGAVALIHHIEDMDALEKLQREFISGISHELKTPLTAIRSHVQPLIDGTIEDEEISGRFLTVICQEADRLTELINKLIDYSRLHFGKKEPQSEPFVLEDLILSILESLEDKACKRKIDFQYVVSEGLPEVEGDPFCIRQALFHLLDNAISYTPEGGKVEIQASLEEKKVRLTVADTGVGIDEKDLPFIWNRFFRGRRNDTNAERGLGLGLAIVKEVIEAHGEEITVTSTHRKGTRFTFTLKTCC